MKPISKTELIKQLQEDLIPHTKYYLVNNGETIQIQEAISIKRFVKSKKKSILFCAKLH